MFMISTILVLELLYNVKINKSKKFTNERYNLKITIIY